MDDSALDRRTEIRNRRAKTCRQLRERYTCPICYSHIMELVQFTRCTHFTCRECYDRLDVRLEFRGEERRRHYFKRCPVCRRRSSVAGAPNEPYQTLVALLYPNSCRRHRWLRTTRDALARYHESERARALCDWLTLQFYERRVVCIEMDTVVVPPEVAANVTLPELYYQALCLCSDCDQPNVVPGTRWIRAHEHGVGDSSSTTSAEEGELVTTLPWAGQHTVLESSSDSSDSSSDAAHSPAAAPPPSAEADAQAREDHFLSETWFQFRAGVLFLADLANYEPHAVALSLDTVAGDDEARRVRLERIIAYLLTTPAFNHAAATPHERLRALYPPHYQRDVRRALAGEWALLLG